MTEIEEKYIKMVKNLDDFSNNYKEEVGPAIVAFVLIEYAASILELTATMADEEDIRTVITEGVNSGRKLGKKMKKFIMGDEKKGKENGTHHI